MGKSKRENQIKINYFPSSCTDYHSNFLHTESICPSGWWCGAGERGLGGREGG